MTNTSYVSVKAEELQTACELWLDARKERIKNKLEKLYEDLMLIDQNSWLNKKLGKAPTYLTREQAIEKANDSEMGMYSPVQWIEHTGSGTQERVEKILYACKVPHYGFVNLSVEDNAILEGYYEQ